MDEGMLAAIATAGLRIVLQANISATGSANVSYTVQDAATRRVMVVHNAGAAFDIRVERNAAATATDFPIIPQFYFAIDCEKDDTIQFYNVGTTTTVYILELE